jgi:hypothetical protein
MAVRSIKFRVSERINCRLSPHISIPLHQSTVFIFQNAPLFYQCPVELPTSKTCNMGPMSFSFRPSLQSIKSQRHFSMLSRGLGPNSKRPSSTSTSHLSFPKSVSADTYVRSSRHFKIIWISPHMSLSLQRPSFNKTPLPLIMLLPELKSATRIVMCVALCSRMSFSFGLPDCIN